MFNYNPQIKMANQELTQQIKSVYNGFLMSNQAISNYLDKWFDHLPTEGKSDVMGNYDAPERDEDNLEFYEYELGEYEDTLYHEFSNSKVEMKVNDFKEYALKYADRMTNNFTF